MAFIPESPSEQVFYRRWRTVAAGAAVAAGAEVDLALAGARMSDRLAWVFMSGYQAALRRCFPEFAVDGWSCFAVAEPKNGSTCRLEPRPGGGYRLAGEKSWIAGAQYVDLLVCSVGEGEDRRFVRVPRGADGLTISLQREATFLKELAQGAARFEDVAVQDGDVVADPVRAQWFRGAEPLYVLLALNGCLGAHAEMQGDRELAGLTVAAVDAARRLTPHLGEKDRIVPGLKSFREATTRVIGAASERIGSFPEAFRRSWEADALLLGMFGVSGARA